MYRILAAYLLIGCAILRADEYAELFQKAVVYSQEGKYREAILTYQAALKIRPKAPEAINNLAVMYYETHEYRRAFETAGQIWESHPELKSAALIRGMAAVQSNRPQDAIAPLEKLLEADPKNRDALLALASARVAMSQLSEATGIYQRQTEFLPSDAMAWYGLAICYERRAEQTSEKLAKMPGGYAYSKRLVAEYLQSAGDSKLAEQAFGDANATASVPDSEAAAQYQLARELAGKSHASFETFINLAPDSWQAALFLGDVARQHGELLPALTYYKKAAGIQPDNPAPLLGMGTVYWEMGNFDEAVRCLRRTLELNPRANQAVFELANIAVRRHSEREAIPLLIQYLAAQPNALAAHADLGRAYFHLEQYEKAAAELNKATAVDDRGDIHYQLSFCLRKLGRGEEADEALKKSQEIREAELKREQQLH